MRTSCLFILLIIMSSITFGKSINNSSNIIFDKISETKKMSTFSQNKFSIEGDINKDGKLSIVDMAIAIQILNEGNNYHYDIAAADINKDGKLTHEDINLFMDRLSSEFSDAETIDAIYISSSNPEFKSQCYLLKNRPQIIYHKDKIVVHTLNSDNFEIPFTNDIRIKIEYGLYEETGIETRINDIANDKVEYMDGKTYLINNRIIIYRKGVKYNINGTLYK